MSRFDHGCDPSVALCQFLNDMYRNTEMTTPVRNYLAEFVGTFVLVFIGTAVATLTGTFGYETAASLLMISFAFGLTLMVLVWVIGPVSGCHINPAVTIAMAMSGRARWTDLPGYLVAQLLGGIVASLVLMALLSGLPAHDVGSHGLGANGNAQGMSTFALLLWEVLLTALFLFTIFAATRDDTNPGVTGLTIGGFLLIAHLVGAQLGDSSLNPARSLGPALLQGGAALGDVWIFIIGPIVGGIVGWIIYKGIYGAD